MAGRSVVVYEKSPEKEETLKKVVDRIKWDAEGRTPILVLFFSTNLRFYYYASRLTEEFSESTVVGAVTDMNICSDGMGETGLSAIAVFEGIECQGGVILDITRHPMKYKDTVTDAMRRLSRKNNTICLEFTTALLKSEELVLDTLEQGLKGSRIPIVGSSTAASDGNIMTYVSYNGQVYSEGTVFLLIRNLYGKIGIFKENMFKPTSFQFTVTDVDCEDRTIYELDGRNAAMFLSDKLSVKREDLITYLKTHPFGRKNGDDICISAVSDMEEDGSLSCYSRVYNRTKLILLEPDSYKEVWDKTLEQVNSVIPNRSFSILINCCERTSIFKEENILEDFREKLMYSYGGYLGISGNGEQLNNDHLNQTMIMAVFE